MMTDKTSAYDEVRRPEHSTLGDAAERFERDPDAFTAGAQNVLDRLLYRLSRSPCDPYDLETVVAEILDAVHEGRLA